MKVKWIHGNSTDNITDFISSLVWGGSSDQAARTLEISVVYSPYDRNISDPNIQLGDRLKLYNNEKLLIDVMVYSRERNEENGTITYSGYDDLNHLLRSNVSHNFKNVTPENITRTICNELKVKIGSIATTGVNIKSLLSEGEAAYNVIMKAYTQAHNSNGKKYMPIMSGRKLYIIEKGEIIENFELSNKVNITGSSYTETLDSMVNRVLIYNDKGKQVGEVNNTDWINSYGVFQNIFTKEDGVDPNRAAKNMLIGIEKTASIEALGNINCISGYGLKITDTFSGLAGAFWISNDTHTWENNKHTMSLELAFKNIMDVQEID